MSLIKHGRILGRMESSEMEKAESNILNGLEFFKEMKLKPDTAKCYLFLGEFYNDSGQEEKAIDNLKKAHEMFKDMQMEYWQEKTQKIIDRL